MITIKRIHLQVSHSTSTSPTVNRISRDTVNE